MKSYLRTVLSIIFLLISASTFASDSSYIKFIFPDSLPVAKFRITVSDGIDDHQIDPAKTRNWQGELFSPFGQIIISYANTDTSGIAKKYFFKKGRSEVFITASPVAGEYYSIDERSSVNIIPYGKMGGDVFDAFIKEREDTLLAFYHRNKNYFGRDNALAQQVFALSDSLGLKKIEFIRQFPDEYISSWVFLNHRIAKTNYLPPEKLMELFNTVFSDGPKRSKASDYAASVIRNKIAIASRANFPDFSTVDINNNEIELSKLKGSYVLIQFWASWCRPCIEEIPALKDIYEKYGGPEFKLISFSVDRDLSAGRKAIEKYSMNWPQVIGDYRLYDTIGYTPIPQLYLIDKNGHTIYDNTTIKDNDLVLLKKLLAEHLPHVIKR